MIYEITDSRGKTVQVRPKVELYAVKNFMGKKMPGLAIDLVTAGDYPEPYARLTVSFGEFISIKNAAYIDTNNCRFAEQLLQYGFAQDTGLKTRSGYCQYPLWLFKEDFLKEHGAENYQKYSDAYDEYMNPYTSDVEETDENQEIGGLKQ